MLKRELIIENKRLVNTIFEIKHKLRYNEEWLSERDYQIKTLRNLKDIMEAKIADLENTSNDDRIVELCNTIENLKSKNDVLKAENQDLEKMTDQGTNSKKIRSGIEKLQHLWN